MAWSEPLYDRTAQDVKDVQTIMNKILISGYDSLTEDEIDLVNGRTRGTFSANAMSSFAMAANSVYSFFESIENQWKKQDEKEILYSTERNLQHISPS